MNNLTFVIPGCAAELGFTRVRQYHCPSRQQPTWMRRPGIHTPRRGYGFRAHSLRSRPGMTKADLQIQRLVAAEDAVLVEGDTAVAGQIGPDIRPDGNAVVQVDQAGNP